MKPAPLPKDAPLPPPCEECAPLNGFVIVERERNGVMISGARPCTNPQCARAQEVARRAEERKARQEAPAAAWAPQISNAAATKAVRMLGGNVPFFPGDESAQTMIASELRRLCNTNQELGWLVRQVMLLWKQWHGVRELRILFCSKFRPVDGVDLEGAVSVAFPETGYPPALPMPSLEPSPAQLGAWEKECGPADPEGARALLRPAIDAHPMPQGQTKVLPFADPVQESLL